MHSHERCIRASSCVCVVVVVFVVLIVAGLGERECVLSSCIREREREREREMCMASHNCDSGSSEFQPSMQRERILSRLHPKQVLIMSYEKLRNDVETLSGIGEYSHVALP